MKTIKLKHGHEALVDDEDFEYLSQWNWSYCLKNYRESARRSTRTNGKFKTIYMHQMLLSPRLGYMVDHKDGNALNNCKNNLRYATNSENLRNSKKHKVGTSAYKGVHWAKDKRKWVAVIADGNHRIKIGYYHEELIAALAYDIKAKEIYREFARTNF
jgi:hypothetical protein